MSAFVSSPAAPSSANTDVAGTYMVVADGWYPPIDMVLLRKAVKIGADVDDERVKDAVITAMIAVGIELMLWKLAHVDAGVEQLEDLPGDMIAGAKIIVHLWRRAVYSFVAAELAENSRDISATKDGADRAEEKALTADDHRRNGIHAIRDMLGVGRTTVELI
ncbi:MAG: 31, BuPhKS14 gp31 [Novosphingobium sp.]|nr:31, BuPhKS14 gp31 [Novosphingobium sp.]